MRVWLLIKLLALLAVLAVLGFTAGLGYHVMVRPLGGFYEQVLPNPGEILGGSPEADFARMLESDELPDVEPGERAYRKAHELLALGRLDEARERLSAIVNVFPNSNAAPTARRIVSEMNLDDLLSTRHMAGKETYTVRPGDSYFAIASRHRSTLEMILHLNGLLELRNLQPGDKLIVMPLDLRLLIEPRREALSLWDGGRFIAEYPILGISGPAPAPRVSRIESKTAFFEGRRISPDSTDYRGAEKILQIAGLSQPLRALPRGLDEDDELPRGIFLQPHDMEELALLTRPGNEVEIRR